MNPVLGPSAGEHAGEEKIEHGPAPLATVDHRGGSTRSSYTTRAFKRASVTCAADTPIKLLFPLLLIPLDPVLKLLECVSRRSRILEFPRPEERELLQQEIPRDRLSFTRALALSSPYTRAESLV